MHVFDIETTCLVQAAFFAPLLFLLVYSARTPWWRTIHGRTLAALAGVFVVVLLRSVLFDWHALRPSATPDLWAWVTINALVLAPLAFLTMTWQLLRKPVRSWARFMRHQRDVSQDPLTADARPARHP